jgi:hypothetical protein
MRVKSEPSRSYVTIVSGMPRSGTSLMMRMLDAGGIPAVSDGRRIADGHNPHGYYEDERAGRLAQDSSWMEEARGQAVKIIYRLLPHLPPRLDYRVLFMDRDLHEVYESQQAMLLSRGDPAAEQDRTIIGALSRELEDAKQWIARQSNIRYLLVPYAEVIRLPQIASAQVAQFLDGNLDEAAMASVVDPGLYRHRR